jgi:hypothetical protein
VDGVGESIDGIGVVEGLSTEGLEKGVSTFKRGAVINVGIGLDDPDEFLAWVVEVELNLVTGRTDRFITSELELLNQVLVGVLGELSAFIGIQEDIVDVERGCNKGLLVCPGDRKGSTVSGQVLDCPQALTNRAEIDVNLDFVKLYIHGYPSFRSIYWNSYVD